MSASNLEVHFLDVGRQMYGDAILVRAGDVSVLIDGGHRSNLRSTNETPSLPEQLQQVLGSGGPFLIDLLVVTHCHSDHIGCLPELVASGQLQPRVALVADELLGFGRSSAERADEPAPLPAVMRQVLAGLREESRVAVEPDELRRFLQDVVTLEQRYVTMLARLEHAGTRVVRFGVDDHGPLIEQFAALGLRVWGPTPEQLLVCAETIQRAQRRAARALLQTADARMIVDPVQLYLQAAGMSSQSDAGSAPASAAVNNQSIVLSVGAEGQRVLLCGDMQFAAPGITEIQRAVSVLYDEVVAAGPYEVVKSAHHTSSNGFLPSQVLELTSRHLVHTGGWNDVNHPDRRVLTELAALRPAIQFARTDHNGLVSFRGGVLEVERGSFNDFSPNTSGDAVTGGVASADEIHVHVHLSRDTSNLHLHLHFEDKQQLPRQPEPEAPPTKRRPVRIRRQTLDETPLVIAGGRSLPRLAFVTNVNLLMDRVGEPTVRVILETLKSEGHEIVLAQNQTDAVTRLSRVQDVSGVVILGGYDVLPAVRLTTLTRELEDDDDLEASDDADHFIIWSDELYGDVDADGLAERPVSRIPDGGDGEVLLAALRGAPIPEVQKYGIRNEQRPFADDIWSMIPGSQNLFLSGPQDTTSLGQGVASQVTYLMLHGNAEDKSRFWGDTSNGPVEAVRNDLIPASTGGVIFAGCCYGALITAASAADSLQDEPACISVDESIALSFLRAGARAFIGCTGVHYSPVGGQDAYGSPLHRFFMQRLTTGNLPPAQALFEARRDYFKGIPYTREDAFDRAIELKTWQQFTCLGLGW